MDNYQNQNESLNNPNPYNDNGNFMQKNLQNGTVSIVLGIISIICCCTVVIGLICSIIGLILANKDLKLYQSAPQQYTGIQNVNTGRILNIIGLVLSVGYLLYAIFQIIMLGGWDAYYETIQEAIRVAQAQQGA